MTQNRDRLIHLEQVSFGYPESRCVLDGADFTLRTGERIGLVGDIGSGKTTLLHMIMGLILPDAGIVEAFGRTRAKERDFWDVRERVGLLFQDSEDQLFCPTVREDIAFGPLNQGKPREAVDAIVKRTLEQVGLPGFENRVTHHLSGGEMRLISLATILAMEPDVLLLDEPENGLDPAAYSRILTLLNTLPQAMVVVSHDADFLTAVTDRSVRMENGKLVDIDTHHALRTAGAEQEA